MLAWERPTCSGAIASGHYLQHGSAWGQTRKQVAEGLLPLVSHKPSVLSFESNLLAPQMYFLLLISLSVTMVEHHQSGFMANNTIH